MKKIKRILLLTIDALSQQRFSSLCKRRHDDSALAFLAENGIFCEKAFSHGLPTQLSFPSIFTSTYPLDCGGYDYGIKKRPMSLAEAIRNEGYKTIGLNTCNPLNQHYGYERGFDEFYNLFDIKEFWRAVSKVYLSYYIRQRDKGNFNHLFFCEKLEPILRGSFEFILLYCRETRASSERGLFVKNHVIQKYDYAKIEQLIKSELSALSRPEDYFAEYGKIDGRLERIFTASELARRDYFCRAGDDILRRFDRFCKKNRLGRVIKRYDGCVSGGYLSDTVIRFIDKNCDKDFFLWTNFFDIHEHNHTSGPIQMPEILCWNGMSRKIFSYSYRQSAAIDKAVEYVDRQLAKIVNFLNEKKLMDETLLVVHGDHGIAAEYPARKVHKARLFYEEFVRVPIIFYNPRIKSRRIDSLCGLIDLAPSILDLLDVNIRPSYGFKGEPVYSDGVKNREFIYMENLGRGPCDFERKPINIALRTERYKYIWREASVRELDDWVDREEWKKYQNELYDLKEDPKELHNLIGDKRLEDIINRFERIARERCGEIRKETLAKEEILK